MNLRIEETDRRGWIEFDDSRYLPPSTDPTPPVVNASHSASSMLLILVDSVLLTPRRQRGSLCVVNTPLHSRVVNGVDALVGVWVSEKVYRPCPSNS